MRAQHLRTALIGGLLAATAVIAQPPFGRAPTAAGQKLKEATESLKSEREKLAEDAATESGNAAERMTLRATLLKKIGELDKLRSAPPSVVLPPPKPVPVPPVGVKPETKWPPPSEGSTSLDPLRESQNLYQAGQVDAAYRALQFLMQQPDTLSPHDRAFAQYLSACCQRRMGKLPEAAALFREIADSKPDVVLTESALSQLSLIRSAQEFEKRMEELRARRSAR